MLTVMSGEVTLQYLLTNFCLRKEIEWVEKRFPIGCEEDVFDISAFLTHKLSPIFFILPDVP